MKPPVSAIVWLTVLLSPCSEAAPAYRPTYPSVKHGGHYLFNYYFPPAPSSTPWAPCWSPDGKWIAVAGAAPEVNIYNAETGALASACKGHTAGIYTLAFSPDSATLAAAGFDGQVRLYRTSGGDLQRAFVPVPLVHAQAKACATAIVPHASACASVETSPAVVAKSGRAVFAVAWMLCGAGYQPAAGSITRQSAGRQPARSLTSCPTTGLLHSSEGASL